MILDEDDHQNYEKLYNGELGKKAEVMFVMGPQLKLVEKLNLTALGWEKEGYLCVGFMGDDCVFMTPGWEDVIIHWQKKHKGICYGNDLLQGENLPNNVFIHVDIIAALGFMAPPELQHYYIDNYWKDLGLRLNNIQYFENVVIEHRHWSNQKEQKDATYTNAESLMGQDRAAWDNYRETKLAEDVQIINDYGKR